MIDPLFILGVITVFVTIAVPVIIFFLERKRKSLIYGVLANTSLIALDEEIKGKIKILFDDISVQKVHLLILEILNDGNVPIESSDFERPLTFSFGENTQILSFEIVKTEPDDFNLQFNTFDNHIGLISLLINRKDSFQLKLLLAEFDGEIKVEARINGVKKVKEVKDIQKAKEVRKSLWAVVAWIFWLVILTAFVVLMAIIIQGELSLETVNSMNINFIKGFLYGGIFLAIVGLILGRMSKAASTIRKPDSQD